MSTEQSNLARRKEQVLRWSEGETAKESASMREAEKISFSKEVQLLSACNNTDWLEIERLLEEGIDINSTQDDGLTALHQACIDDDEPLVKYLIDKGANIDAQDKEGWTPLFAAISCNYIPITKYLISCGARLDIVSFDGELSLDQANNETIASIIKDEMTKHNLDCEEIRNREKNILLTDVDFMKKTKDFSKFTMVDNGGSLLHIAASKDYIDVLERLIEILPPELLNHSDNDGWNALHVAAHWGNRKACVLLVNADIEFDKLTLSNQTVLEVSDDEVKPYIREEIRKARFRRQERVSIKRPAESPHTEFQPKETKIICQDNNQFLSVEQPYQSNGDQHTMMESLDNNCTSISISEKVKGTDASLDINLKLNKKDYDTVQYETCPEKSQDNNSIISAETTVNISDNNEYIEKNKNLDNQNLQTSAKIVAPILPLGKTAESESQRKDKARHVRSSRKSTQGVTAEDIDEAKKYMLADRVEQVDNKIKTISDIVDTDVSPAVNHSETERSFLIANTNENEPQKIEMIDKSLNGDSLNNKKIDTSDISVPAIIDSSDHSEKKPKTVAHVVNKRRTRERPPTGIDIKDIQAAQKECAQLKDLKLLPENHKEQEHAQIDYKVLYENELKEKEKLQLNLAILSRDLEKSQSQIKNLQNNRIFPKVQTQTCTMFEIKELEKLRLENKKMKDSNSALIRVISRLSHPPTKSLASFN